MGGDNATSPTFTGFQFHDVSVAGAPEDYFNKLGIDMLQVALRGVFKRSDVHDQLTSLLREAQRARENKQPLPVMECPGGELEVLPHGGSGYRMVLRAFEMPTVRIFPNLPNAPAIIIRFGARWCFEYGLAKLRTWIDEFVASITFAIDEVLVSRVDLRCDIDERFDSSDRLSIRGHCTRGGKVQEHHSLSTRDLETITNLGGSSSLRFAIYNKRKEQLEKRGTFWPGVWKAYGIDESIDIWRIEGRFYRDRLKKNGVHLLDDLTPDALRQLWHNFTVDYLTLVIEPDRRTSRATVDPKWARIAELGEFHDPTPVEFKTSMDSSHAMKTAAGHIVGAMIKTRRDINRISIAQAVDTAIDQARSDERLLTRISIQQLFGFFIEAVNNHEEVVLIDDPDWRNHLESILRRKSGLDAPSHGNLDKPRETDGYYV